VGAEVGREVLVFVRAVAWIAIALDEVCHDTRRPLLELLVGEREREREREKEISPQPNKREKEKTDRQIDRRTYK
jgi:hypothetical protein